MNISTTAALEDPEPLQLKKESFRDADTERAETGQFAPALAQECFQFYLMDVVAPVHLRSH